MQSTCSVPWVIGLLGARRLVPLPAVSLPEEAAWVLTPPSPDGFWIMMAFLYFSLLFLVSLHARTHARTPEFIILSVGNETPQKLKYLSAKLKFKKTKLYLCNSTNKNSIYKMQNAEFKKKLTCKLSFNIFHWIYKIRRTSRNWITIKDKSNANTDCSLSVFFWF